MFKQIGMTALSVLLFISVIGIQTVTAETTVKQPSRNEVFTTLHQAFQAQLQLGNDHRTKEEAEKLLQPHFQQPYITKFLDENITQEAQGYITYGTDFALYYIPYFSYDENTKMKYNQQKNIVYVYEHFPAIEDGPVSYGEHYECIVLKQEQGVWKVSDYSYNETLPKEITK
ncbi:DUF3993 domain-containing protein [Bacillus sp. CGMCC 1.16541]|uniref:DUF3993 domain-containing protein n=1 Tax=Bacillus sp. CGMCC 1.16541 TaxID=2185143 RepID=UPI0013A5BB09|nr:DUF3993 domain-containing protein [Bacillus sp. CGMCC 1.16541]